MSRPLLLLDLIPWREAWADIARLALGLLRGLPPPAFEPLRVGPPPSQMRAELTAHPAIASLPPEVRREVAELVGQDPFLLRAPAGFWRTVELASPCEALELRAPIIQAKRMAAGSKVSYAHAGALPREGVVATVAIGYGDGYKRCFSNRAFMSFEGHPAPVLGRVCMDQALLDLSAHPAAELARSGASVLVAGGPRRPGLGSRGCDFETLAETFDLPPHELVGGLGPRVETVRGGQWALEPAPRPRPAPLY